ncbi:MAG TPA: CHAT domain-containing tetratricopeptide repeat protein [Gemmataceae bacterium]|nr:CHAT domain-containing tetratricopeptide repeat protein [Gemmataceae bacterium]
MKRVLLGLVLGMTLVDGWCAVAAEDPPKKLTPEERKELEAKWKELNEAGMKYYQAGKLPEATEAAEKALETARRLYPRQDHPDLAKSLKKLAFVLRAQRKYADAESLYREALAMYRRLHPRQDHPLLAKTLNNLAFVLWYQGKYADAESFFREALAMYRRLHPRQDHPDLAVSLNNLARVLQDREKLADAEPLFREVVEMLRRLYPERDHPHLADGLTSLALVLHAQGKYADAEPLLRDAVEMKRRLYPKQDRPDLAGSLSSLATVLQARGKDADAEALHREALAMRRRLYAKQDHSNVAQGLNNLAVVLHARGRYADAEPLYREALAMRRRLYPKQDHPHLATSLNNLAAVLKDRGKYADAEPLYRDALEMYRRLYPKQDHPHLATSLSNLAGLLKAREKYADAEPLFRDALRMFRSLAGAYAAVRSEGEALTLAASYPLTRDGFLSNARALQADPAAVYAEVWASKAALSRVYERRALAARAAASNPRAATLLSQLTERRRRRADLLLAPVPNDPETRKQRDADLDRYAKEIEKLDRDFRPLLPAVERAEKLAKAAPTDLQKVLPPDAAVVDFLRYTLFEQDPKKPGKGGEKRTLRYLAFVVTKDKMAWLDLGPAQPIEDPITAWREAITGGKQIPPELPAKVRDLAWAKVRKEIPKTVKVVYVSPDLALCRVPWAALPGDKPNTILLEDYAVAVVPHGPFLLDKLWPQDRLPKRPSGVLAVGGVAYDTEPPVSEQVALNRGDPLLKPGQKLPWPNLPGATAEAEGVDAAAKKKNLDSQTLGGKKATVSAVLAALPKARYAHLATHGFFADASFRSAFRVDPELFQRTLRGERIGAGALSPMVMTGLVFAGANRPGTPGRGIATGEALVDLNLSGLELAVLSACETGLGDVADGEGTFGLQRALHLAGTRDVVASLWKVPDRPTAALMALFYHNLWEKELPPVEALRQAQLEIYRHPDKIPDLAKQFRGKFVEVPGSAEEVVKPSRDGKAHPRLWAAFTLSGPGR